MRRRALRRVSVVGLSAALLWIPAPEVSVRAGQESDPPNVLIILTDDQRWDTLSVMKKTRRWFVQEGTRFPYAFATTPLCCPSRASIFTGQYNHNNNVETNLDADRLDQRSTMQRYLQDAGYHTAIVGKYLNDWQGDPPFFHDWRIFTAGGAGYREATYNVDGRTRTVRRYSTRFVASQAERLLNSFERNDEDPWFLHVAPFAPHAPYHPEKRYEKTKVPGFKRNPAVNEIDRTDKPPWVQAKFNGIKKVRTTWRLQLRMLLSVDDLVDRLIRELEALGEQGTTIAFFLSDNGFLLGEHGLRQKHSPYTASVTLPFLARWPGHLPAGAVDDRLVANIDIAPTVYDAAGIQTDSEHPVDGRSILGDYSRDRMLLEYHHREDRAVPTWASLRTQTYQYVEYYDEDLQSVTFYEHYDLVNDPWQVTNLMADGDPINDPPDDLLTQLAVKLRSDRRCEGTGMGEGCP